MLLMGKTRPTMVSSKSVHESNKAKHDYLKKLQ